jgi:hypothetical protein
MFTLALMPVRLDTPSPKKKGLTVPDVDGHFSTPSFNLLVGLSQENQVFSMKSMSFKMLFRLADKAQALLDEKKFSKDDGARFLISIRQALFSRFNPMPEKLEEVTLASTADWIGNDLVGLHIGTAKNVITLVEQFNINYVLNRLHLPKEEIALLPEGHCTSHVQVSVAYQFSNNGQSEYVVALHDDHGSSVVCHDIK